MLSIPAPAPVSWLQRLAAVRDRLAASARFREWAASFPLTQPIARRRARAVFDLCAGFAYSQVLLACVRLRAFDILAEAPHTAHAFAMKTSLSVDAAERLLKAAVALRLIAFRGENKFALGPLGATLVDNPALVSMIEHNAMLYQDLADPLALLRGEVAGATALGKHWAYSNSRNPRALSTEQIAKYTELMAASQPLVANEVLDAYLLDGHHCLLDVGGGDGTFLRTAATRARDLKLMLFDLPAVAQRAQEKMQHLGLGDRVQTFGGDFFNDPLPKGADLISLIRVLHDHDDADALRLLRNVRTALPKEGTLLVAEPMSGTKGAEASGDAYFGLYLLAMGQGRPRTAKAVRGLLEAAGFTNIQPVATRIPLQTRILIARPSR